jgi:hypothetical protein
VKSGSDKILLVTSDWRLLCYTELIILHKMIVDKSDQCNILNFVRKFSTIIMTEF